MKVLTTEQQNELIKFFTKMQDMGVILDDEPRPAYFLEELRPKRVRKKKVEIAVDNPQ